MPVDDGHEGLGQIGVRLDGVEFAGFDQRGDGGPVLGTGVVARKEGVFAAQGNRADGALAPLPGR